MINTLLGKVFGTKNEREVKRLQPRVAAISAFEPEMQKLSDEQLRAKTDEFRARIQERLRSVPDEPLAQIDPQSSDPQNAEQPGGDRQKEIEKLAMEHCNLSPLIEESDDYRQNHPNPYVDVYESLAASPNARALPRLVNWPQVSAFAHISQIEHAIGL